MHSMDFLAEPHPRLTPRFIELAAPDLVSVVHILRQGGEEDLAAAGDISFVNDLVRLVTIPDNGNILQDPETLAVGFGAAVPA